MDRHLAVLVVEHRSELQAGAGGTGAATVVRSGRRRSVGDSDGRESATATRCRLVLLRRSSTTTPATSAPSPVRVGIGDLKVEERLVLTGRPEHIDDTRAAHAVVAHELVRAPGGLSVDRGRGVARVHVWRRGEDPADGTRQGEASSCTGRSRSFGHGAAPSVRGCGEVRCDDSESPRHASSADEMDHLSFSASPRGPAVSCSGEDSPTSCDHSMRSPPSAELTCTWSGVPTRQAIAGSATWPLRGC